MQQTGNAFGIEMQRRRTAAGLSLSGLAACTYASKGHLSRVENGLKRPAANLVRLIDAALGADGALVDLAQQRAAPARRSDADQVWVLGVGDDGRPLLGAVSRGELLAGESLTLLGVAPVGWSTRQPPAAARQWRRWLAQNRELGQRYGPQVVLPMVIGQFQSMLALAQGSRGADRNELLLLAARHAEYAGWMLQEAGANGPAIAWTRQAATLAGEAGDRSMAGYALVRMALVTLYDGDHASTVRLASQAADDRGLPPRVRGLASLREAQGHALGGAALRFHRAIDRAELLLAADDSGPAATLGSSAIEHPARAAGAWSLLDLGRPGECATALEREIAQIPAGAHRAYVRYATRCALAHATTRDLDRACALMRPMLPWLEDVDSATIRQDLRRLVGRLRQWPDHRAVGQLLPDIKAMLIPG